MLRVWNSLERSRLFISIVIQPGRVYIIAPKSLSIHARACLPVPQLRPQACHNVRHDSEAIRGNHIPSSGAIRGKHRSIRSHQRQSKAVIGGNQKASEIIIGNQRPSEAIWGNQRPSEAIRGHQRPSEAIRGHQGPSEANRGKQRP